MPVGESVSLLYLCLKPMFTCVLTSLTLGFLASPTWGSVQACCTRPMQADHRQTGLSANHDRRICTCGTQHGRHLNYLGRTIAACGFHLGLHLCMQHSAHLIVCSTGLRHPPTTPLVGPHPKLDPGPRPSRKMKSFFWDKLPENRLQKTFWADHPPSYASLKTHEVIGGFGFCLCCVLNFYPEHIYSTCPVSKHP